MLTNHGLIFNGSQFWVIHRRIEYGPFDYEWSKDLEGVSLLYRGQKFGEHCGPSQIYADLKDFSLPMTVVEVASIVLGTLLHNLTTGRNDADSDAFLQQQLSKQGYERFYSSITLNDNSNFS